MFESAKKLIFEELIKECSLLSRIIYLKKSKVYLQIQLNFSWFTAIYEIETKDAIYSKFVVLKISPINFTAFPEMNCFLFRKLVQIVCKILPLEKSCNGTIYQLFKFIHLM